MFCPNCGSENPEVAVFCESCGTKIIDKSQIKNPRISNTTVDEIPERPKVNPKKATVERDQVQIPKKKSASGIKKLVLIELVVLALVGFGFYKVSEVITNPEEIAYRYIVDVHNRNWTNLYNNLSLPKSDFINKDMLVKGNPSTDSMSVENYTISDIEFSSDNRNAVVTIDYNLPGVVKSMSTEVNLIKQSKKKYLIFDSWKVVPEFVVSDYEVKVPTNSQVTIGGVALNTNLIKNQDAEFTYYEIPLIFDGKYEVKVVMDSMEDSVQEVNTKNGLFSLNRMPFSQDVQKSLLIKAGEAFTATYEAAFAKNDFNTIEKLFSTDATKVPLLKDEYMKLINDLGIGNEAGMKAFSFDSIDARTDYYISQKITYVDVLLDYNYQYIAVTQDSWGDKYEDTAKSNGKATYTFAKNGENWEIVNYEIVY